MYEVGGINERLLIFYIQCFAVVASCHAVSFCLISPAFDIFVFQFSAAT